MSGFRNSGIRRRHTALVWLFCAMVLFPGAVGAEKDKIERLGEKDLFSKFLPYAIALDVADNWAKAFEGIYMDSPYWYVGAGGFQTHTPHFFSRSIDSMASSLGAAMFSTPAKNAHKGLCYGPSTWGGAKPKAWVPKPGKLSESIWTP